MLIKPLSQGFLPRIILGLLFYISSLQAISENFTQNEKLWLASHPVIRVGFHTSIPPYAFTDHNGEAAGILSSYLNHFETLLKIQFKPIYANSWEDLLQMANEGLIDIVCGFPSFLESPDYLKLYKPLFNVPISALVDKDSLVFENLEEFLRKNIAVIDEELFAYLIQESYPDLKPTHPNSVITAIKNINSKKIDGVILESRKIDYFLQESSIQGSFLKYTLPLDYTMHIAIHQDLHLMQSIMEKVLTNLSDVEKNGFITQWINSEKESLWKTWHFIFVIVLLLLVIIFLIMIQRLHHLRFKKIETENRFINNYLETIADALDAGSWIWHITDNKTIVNSRYATMLGYTKDEIQPTFDGMMGLVAPEDNTLMLSALKRHIDKIEPFFSVYIKLRHKDGSYRFVHSFGGIVDTANDGSPKTLAGLHLLVQEDRPRTTENYIEPVGEILNHNHYRAFVPLYFKQAKREYSGVMLVLFQLGFREDDEKMKQEILQRFSIALFEHLPAPSGLCFYMGENVFASFYWHDDPSEAQIVAQDLQIQLDTVITTFSSSIILQSGSAFMLPGSNVDEAILYQNAYANLAQKEPF